MRRIVFTQVRTPRRLKNASVAWARSNDSGRRVMASCDAESGPAITLVPATRLWDALRDVWEVDVDLSEEVAWLLSAEPLVCRADTVVVPAAKLDAAGIARDGELFTIIGVADRFELWPTEAWQRDSEGFDLEGLFGSRS